ncbi:MAG: copper amine oxidase N-terminal domain-containing protein [Clostridiales bacterium]|jgi:hypothetical protein|nr:copper amine oxidase N-terminal domain-containing protein [Clostridiales bacterium]
MKKFKYFIAGFLLAALMSLGIGVLAAANARVNIVVNGEDFEGEVILIDGWAFLPAEAFAQKLGLDLKWDEDSFTLYIGNNSPLLGIWRAYDDGDEFVSKFTPDGRVLLIEQGFTEGMYWSAENGVLTITETWWRNDPWRDEVVYYRIYGNELVVEDIFSGDSFALTPFAPIIDPQLVGDWLVLGLYEELPNEDELEFQVLSFFENGLGFSVEEFFWWTAEDGALSLFGNEPIYYEFYGNYLYMGEYPGHRFLAFTRI